MRAAVVKAFGPATNISLENSWPRPSITKKQVLPNKILFTLIKVLVRVKASGVNPVDTYIRAGQYAILPELPYIPGREGAGIVEQVIK